MSDWLEEGAAILSAEFERVLVAGVEEAAARCRDKYASIVRQASAEASPEKSLDSTIKLCDRIAKDLRGASDSARIVRNQLRRPLPLLRHATQLLDKLLVAFSMFDKGFARRGISSWVQQCCAPRLDAARKALDSSVEYLAQIQAAGRPSDLVLERGAQAEQRQKRHGSRSRSRSSRAVVVAMARRRATILGTNSRAGQFLRHLSACMSDVHAAALLLRVLPDQEFVPREHRGVFQQIKEQATTVLADVNKVQDALDALAEKVADLGTLDGAAVAHVIRRQVDVIAGPNDICSLLRGASEGVEDIRKKFLEAVKSWAGAQVSTPCKSKHAAAHANVAASLEAFELDLRRITQVVENVADDADSAARVVDNVVAKVTSVASAAKDHRAESRVACPFQEEKRIGARGVCADSVRRSRQAGRRSGEGARAP